MTLTQILKTLVTCILVITFILKLAVDLVYFSFILLHVESIRDRGDACRVVASVLQSLERIEQKGRRWSSADVTNYTAQFNTSATFSSVRS